MAAQYPHVRVFYGGGGLGASPIYYKADIDAEQLCAFCISQCREQHLSAAPGPYSACL